MLNSPPNGLEPFSSQNGKKLGVSSCGLLTEEELTLRKPH